jgi:secondary thiamine-phosphate synthase enzyme
MRQLQHRMTLPPARAGLHAITGPVGDWLAGEDVSEGLLTLFVRHTSASLLIQENADPDVLRDLESFFARLVPEDAALYRHREEGPDDMPAHIRCALTQTHLAVPVSDGRLLLGMWQGIYLFEHRARPHRREIVLHYLGT